MVIVANSFYAEKKEKEGFTALISNCKWFYFFKKTHFIFQLKQFFEKKIIYLYILFLETKLTQSLTQYVFTNFCFQHIILKAGKRAW